MWYFYFNILKNVNYKLSSPLTGSSIFEVGGEKQYHDDRCQIPGNLEEIEPPRVHPEPKHRMVSEQAYTVDGQPIGR